MNIAIGETTTRNHSPSRAVVYVGLSIATGNFNSIYCLRVQFLAKMCYSLKSLNLIPVKSSVYSIETQYSITTCITPRSKMLGGVRHVVIVACNYPLSAYMNCNSSFVVA